MRPPQAPATNIDAGGLKSPRIATDLEIDVTAEICPMTYVRTRLALDRLQAGQLLAVTLRGDEPARNVPETARVQGHEVLEEAPGQDGTTRVVIRKR